MVALTIVQELACTRSARWYAQARNDKGSGSWPERALCFDALASLLEEQRAARVRGQRWRQPHVRPPSLARVAARSGIIAQSTMYNYWGQVQGSKTMARWAPADSPGSPGAAFIAEAKVVTFWPYRCGLLHVADAMEMTTQEVTFGYQRSLAAWAADQPVLAACEPVAAPGCTAEDMAVVARRAADPSWADVAVAAAAARLTDLAGRVIEQVLDDISLSPLGAFNVVRDEVVGLLAGRPDPLFPRVNAALVELADGLLHCPGEEPVLTAGQAADLRAMMTGLLGLLTQSAAGTATADDAASARPDQGVMT
jgi:hypothetical protein